MAVETRTSFLIDSLLEKDEATEENMEDSSFTQDCASSSLNASIATSSRSTEREHGTTRLTRLISNMIESNREGCSNLCSRSLLDHSLQQKVVLPSSFEYFSKLQAMHQALHFGALSSLRHQSAMMQISNKDYFATRPTPAFQTAKVETTGRGNSKKYRCDVCDKMFSRSNTLITHKRIHTGEKPFKCDHCGRAFRQPGNLTRHRLTHTTVKPYVCTHCNKAFNRASNLHTHMRTHSGK